MEMPFPDGVAQQMFSLNSVLQSLHPSKLVSNLASNYTKLKDRISPPLPITQVGEGLFHCDFPQRGHVTQLAEHSAGKALLLINLSEYAYEEEFTKSLQERTPNAVLLHLNYELYAALPLCELIETITKVQTALGKGQRVYLHCQQGRVRSAVFLASFLNVAQGVDISQAILRVNKLLAIDLESGQGYRSQHALFKHLVNYTTDRNCINPNRIRLTRVAITNAPRIRYKQGPILLEEVQVILQVRCGPTVVHRSAYPQGVSGDDAVCIQISKKVIVSDDFLVILKYLHHSTAYNVLRIQANTNFIYNCFARVHQHDADLSAHCLPSSTAGFIDLTFAPDSELSKLALLSRPAVALPASKQNKDKSWDLLGADSELYAQEEERFEWLQEAEIDEHELNSKIEQVMQNMHKKEEQRGEDKQGEQGEEEEDFDDYLGKLQAQAHH